MILVCALSLSLGWGIRGNFGHEYGAMIPGALAAMAAVLMSGRPDWHRRAAYFGMLGAVGWAFGGSISYMRVIAYTHSGHLPSQIYGFACLAVIGFLWAALGGAGTALAACLDRRRLEELFPPMLAVFAAWFLKALIIPFLDQSGSGAARHESVLYWYDTNWLAALTAPVAVLIMALIRRRFCWGTSLILYLALGWWAGFLLVVFFVDVLGIEFRMTPPRGDNWAGIAGMTVAALIYFSRQNMQPAVRAALVAGFWGGAGFPIATFLKLAEVKGIPLLLGQLFGESAWQTNWHSILEQTYGLINGIGVGVAMIPLARQLPIMAEEPRGSRWTDVVAVAFVLLLIPYLNLIQNVPHWIQIQALPERLYSIRSQVWFEACSGLVCVAVLVLLGWHIRRPLEVVPSSPLGKAQLLYLVLLWVIVAGNLARALPPFQEQRLITEGVIHVNATLCTLLILLWHPCVHVPDRPVRSVGRLIMQVMLVGLASLIVIVALASAGTRLIHGDTFAGHASFHTRFGPDAETGKPKRGLPHP
jgi:hypothetical protein